MFRVGQTGEIIQNMQSYQWNSVAGQLGMLFNFLFFITFGIFILNLVFAVIVDSFGGMRERERHNVSTNLSCRTS